MNARDITRPMGLVLDMSNAAYHALPALGSSGLKALAKSPLHYFGQYMDPARPERETTPAMKRGTLAHTMLLEPDTINERYAIKPPGHDGRTKEGKAWASAFASMEIITADEHAAAARMADAVRSLPDVAALMSEGAPEISAFWDDEETGIACKCRPDWVRPTGHCVVILDLKTCQDSSPAGFARTAANMNYAAQASWYSTGYEKASGQQVVGFVFAAVEAEWPHAAAAYMLSEEWMAKARERNAELLRLYTDCLATGHWPAYGSEIQTLEAPRWI